jgi:hypothetical protein
MGSFLSQDGLGEMRYAICDMRDDAMRNDENASNVGKVESSLVKACTTNLLNLDRPFVCRLAILLDVGLLRGLLRLLVAEQQLFFLHVFYH